MRENENEWSYSTIVYRGSRWDFLEFKLYLYTTLAGIRNQENKELCIFNVPFLRGAKYDRPSLNTRAKSI